MQPMAGESLAVGTWGLLPYINAALWEGASLWHRLREGCADPRTDPAVSAKKLPPGRDEA